MVDAAHSALKVALVAEEGKQRSLLQGLLRQHQLDVMTCMALSELSEDSLHQLHADVILIDLVEEPEESALEFLIESAPAPILFSESQMSSGRGWGDKLVSKLIALADRSRSHRMEEQAVPVVEPKAEPEPETEAVSPVSESVAEELPDLAPQKVELPNPADQEGDLPDLVPLETVPLESASRPALKVVAETAPESRVTAEPVRLVKAGEAQKEERRHAEHPGISVCVLGASIGGPDAVKKFLGQLQEDLPISFLLAQHIGMGFDHRLADQLSRATRLEVRMAAEGDILCPGTVLVVPTQGRLALNRKGEVRISDAPWSGPYSPTINDVMSSAAECFGSMASAILFSGMGNDGASGAQEIDAAGGQVWAQDEASCVISSIPDSARQRGVVSYSGTPEQLAQRLMQQCQRQVANGE